MKSNERIMKSNEKDDEKSEKVLTSYKESIEAADGDSVGLDSPSHMPFNSKAWEKAIGDPKNFHGHGITQGPEILDCHGTSFDSSPVNNNEAIIEGQLIARVESDEINKRPCLLTTALTDFRGVIVILSE
ncbi:hypothetical protein Tco_0058918 [Tanacetum coccineum]